ncbi:SNF2-related protein [Leptospira levettii]|uniref:SNF2-related protein n=1 Tax=Leptospira levettii TaxID=2023178 RepID=UPI003EBB1CAD
MNSYFPENLDNTILDNLVNFQLGNESVTDLFETQKKGVIGIINILKEKNIAILADEVGMGKTIQSIAIISILLNYKPDARILIFAPREEVQRNWVKEFDEFHEHDLIRKHSSSKLRNLLVSGKNLEELFTSDNFEKKIFLTRTTSLSFMNFEEPERFNLILERMGSFDLLIIDEAHMFRKNNRESNRSDMGMKLFKEAQDSKFKNVLLLTATPIHSSKDDTKNIVSYFEVSKKLLGTNSEEILKEICIRRLKKISGRNKYQYREEIATETPFSKYPKSELFYALYQKKLIKRIVRERSNGRKHESRIFFGYLEAFESFQIDTISESSTKSEGELNYTEDFKNVSIEKQILQDLIEQFQINDQKIDHPKYDQIVASIINEDSIIYELYKTKVLIFVRRIASSNELAKRINQEFNTIFLKKLNRILLQYFGQELKYTNSESIREQIHEITNAYNESIEEDHSKLEPENEESTNEDNINEKDILHLFRRKNKKFESKDKLERNHLQKFRARFTENHSIFSAFFITDLIDRAKFADIENYENSKVNYFKSFSEAYKIKEKKKLSNYYENLDESFLTLIFNEVKDIVSQNSDIRLEISEYIKIGLLYGSPYILDFYEYYLQSLKETENLGKERIDQLQVFNRMQKIVKDNINKNSLKSFIIEAIKFFPIFKSKISGSNKDRPNSIFYSQDPAYGYTSDTSNKSVVDSFNTPFFPYVLVSTSVLQEGVNLHFYCNKVLHYGIAWTPGDNEQRIGRVDRLFGKMQRELESSEVENPSLEIIYPYMPNTLDELQLSQFLKRKTDVEGIIDNLGSDVRIDKEIKLESEFENDWKNLYLRKKDPLANDRISIPYPIASKIN